MFHYVSMSDDFAHWLSGLKDQALYACVLAYLCNMKNGDFGEINDVGDDVYETSLPSYPNLRFYFSKERRVITILLVSDESNSQPEAVAQAKQIDKIYNDAAITRTKALCAKYGLEAPSNLD
ncbi:MAG: hypothetical protein ROM54_07125 [Anaerobiospirillum sp.]|nr:hypothetical protein [Anaerobiospirillum sp.]